MNPDTKAIGIFETEDDAKKAGHTVPLNQAEASHLLTIPRGERGKELRKLRKHQQAQKRRYLRKERAKARAKR